MENETSWLPDLIRIEDFSGDWQKYEDAIYAVFYRDFKKKQHNFGGKPVKIKFGPYSKGKEFTFWHFISDGDIEEERIPNLRRCERIAWPGLLLENANTDRVKLWAEYRRSKRNYIIATPNFDYLIVLEERNGYFLLKTGYYIESMRKRCNMERAYLKYKKPTPEP